MLHFSVPIIGSLKCDIINLSLFSDFILRLENQPILAADFLHTDDITVP